VCASTDVNPGGTNRNRYTQRPVILRALTNFDGAPKLGQSDLLYW